MARKGVACTVYLEPKTIEKMDKLVETLGITRSKLIQNIMDSAVEEWALLDRLHVWSFAALLRDWKAGIRAWSQGAVAEPSIVGKVEPEECFTDCDGNEVKFSDLTEEQVKEHWRRIAENRARMQAQPA
jgi:hypothetical protein